MSLENGASITSLEEKSDLDPLQIIGTRMLLQLLHGETYFGVERVIREFESPWPMEVLQAVAQAKISTTSLRESLSLMAPKTS